MLLEANQLVIDVTTIAPSAKHPHIFNTYEKLDRGQTLTLLNDHDPKPLYYQLLAKYGDGFSWNYVESGPITWKINIYKRPENEIETIGSITAKDIRKAKVFSQYGIDFCCGGRKTIKEVCEEKNIAMDQLIEDLNKEPENKDQNNYYSWSASFLSTYIENIHHVYIRKALPDLKQVSLKVKEAHSNKHPFLIELEELINLIDNELMSHMMKEEKILFPYIRLLDQGKSEHAGSMAFESISVPMNVMIMEHDSAGEIMSRINSITDNYTLPKDACNTFRYMYSLLDEFENDLHLHIHLENNILFPAALKLEHDLKTKK